MAQLIARLKQAGSRENAILVLSLAEPSEVLDAMVQLEIDRAPYKADFAGAKNAVLDAIYPDVEVEWLHGGHGEEEVDWMPRSETNPVLDESDFRSAWHDKVDEIVGKLRGPLSIIGAPLRILMGRISPEEHNRAMRWAGLAYGLALLFSMDKDEEVVNPVVTEKAIETKVTQKAVPAAAPVQTKDQPRRSKQHTGR